MISIKVPPLGESIVEATISRWLKNEGDAIAAGDTIVELETDKITVEVPALKAGVLAKRVKNEGDVVKVDEVLGEIDESAAGAAQPAAAQAPATQAPATQAPATQAPAAQAPAAQAPAAQTAGAQAAPRPAASPAAAGAAQPSAAQGASDGTQRVSPAAQRVAAESGVDVSQVTGTGRGGVVSKPDVIEHSARGAQGAAPSAPAPTAPRPAPQPARPAPPAAGGNGARETREKMTTRRKRIAENLLNAKQATASLTTFNEVDMTAVMQLRERWKEAIEKKHGVKLTFMPFFIRACCIALKDFPNINAQIDGDSIIYKHYVNMGIAVASDQGLIVPNIKDADRKGMIALSADIADIAKRARDGKLTMDDLTGGTFTITNGGVFGSLVSTPILNYPQVGILGLHKIQERPVVIDGQIVARPMMYVALTYDHRIVDGQHSVQFLVRMKELMEEPGLMAIE